MSWNAAKHPRKAKGPGGGEFAAGGSGATPTNQRPVGTGASGSEVKNLQLRLNQLGAHLATDGLFGPKTRAAVMKFQKANGLKVDGLVGPKTTAALRRNQAHLGTIAKKRRAAQKTATTKRTTIKKSAIP